MKYFTPDLYARLQSFDPRDMDTADAEWERAEERYRRRLKSIGPKLPPSTWKILDSLRLHDAEVLWIGRGASSLRILMRLDAPPHATVELKYTLTQPARFEQHVIPNQFCSLLMQWMYDEFDLGKLNETFKHAILFSNGCHLQLVASKVQVTTFHTVYSQPNGPMTLAG